MMHQRIEHELSLDDRPERDGIIDKDEIIGLIIDLETMSPEDIFSTYFTGHQKQQK